MSILSELLPPANVLVDIEVNSVKKLFELMGVFFENRYGLSKDVVYQALFARERLGSTLLAKSSEWAMPHAVITSISEVLCGLVLLKNSILFDQRGWKASVFLFVLIPPSWRDRVSCVYNEWCLLAEQDDVVETVKGMDNPSALYQYLFHFSSN
ncbi:PTS sugar transporter subunit IIA [Candidatus Ichthyocystis hellenicum]|uniref:PTS sugar transporter subunit IIA n=1 Tax=Candidatus Ichthyocystis hellenicum TaxID=1561003 RepID=UPI000B85D74A|nr:PTS sugar transporter subunit IIA [Candidatus Ichthyocystis hellenicum]